MKKLKAREIALKAWNARVEKVSTGKRGWYLRYPHFEAYWEQVLTDIKLQKTSINFSVNPYSDFNDWFLDQKKSNSDEVEK